MVAAIHLVFTIRTLRNSCKNFAYNGWGYWHENGVFAGNQTNKTFTRPKDVAVINQLHAWLPFAWAGYFKKPLKLHT